MVLRIMETWSLNHVLGWSLSLLLLALPRPLWAQTPGNGSWDPAGFYNSAATDDVSSTDNNATSSLFSSESLSPSQRSLLLSHSAETHTTTVGDLGKKMSLTQACTNKCYRNTLCSINVPLKVVFVFRVFANSRYFFQMGEDVPQGKTDIFKLFSIHTIYTHSMYMCVCVYTYNFKK